ncbi:MAG: DUF1045 domain-containing protein [Stappiaceae bacterium]
MRYAIYYTASSDSDLTRLGSTWLGRDAYSDDEIAQPAISRIPAPRMAELTASPRRYGFHATMKAPFRPKQGATETALFERFDRFCAQTAPVLLPDGLAVTKLGHFLALTPATPSTALNDLASYCVKEFDAFRQDLSPEDLQKRRPASLSDRQSSYLTRWGYPHVFDEFRFHMTLSISLIDADDAYLLTDACRDYFNSVTNCPLRIDRLAICVEPAPGAPFVISHSEPLTGLAAAPPTALAGQETL